MSCRIFLFLMSQCKEQSGARVHILYWNRTCPFCSVKFKISQQRSIKAILLSTVIMNGYCQPFNFITCSGTKFSPSLTNQLPKLAQYFLASFAIFFRLCFLLIFFCFCSQTRGSSARGALACQQILDGKAVPPATVFIPACHAETHTTASTHGRYSLANAMLMALTHTNLTR